MANEGTKRNKGDKHGGSKDMNGNMSTGVKIILGLIMFAIGAALILSATTGTSCVPACAVRVTLQ